MVDGQWRRRPQRGVVPECIEIERDRDGNVEQLDSDARSAIRAANGKARAKARAFSFMRIMSLQQRRAPTTSMAIGITTFATTTAVRDQCLVGCRSVRYDSGSDNWPAE